MNLIYKKLVVLFVILAAATCNAVIIRPGLGYCEIKSFADFTSMPTITGKVLSIDKATQTTGWAANTTYVYKGKIYLDGSSYRFGESIDDACYLKIDDEVLLDNKSWNVATFATITRPAGWYDIDLRLSNQNNDAGPTAYSGFTTTFGFGYKKGDLAEVDSLTNAEGFVLPTDGGMGDFLIAERLEESNVEVVSYNLSNGVLSADIFISQSIGKAGELWLYYGQSDFESNEAGWAGKVKVADITADGVAEGGVIGIANTYTVSGIPSFKNARFCLVCKDAGGVVDFLDWSNDVIVDSTEPVLGSISLEVGYTDVVATMKMLSMSGLTSVDLDLEISTSDTFDTLVAFDGSHRVVTQPELIRFNIVGLNTNTTYYVRHRITDASMNVVSPATSFTTLLPTMPKGNATVMNVTYNSVAVNYIAEDFGDDSDYVDVCVEYSSSPTFDVIDGASGVVRNDDKAIVGQVQNLLVNNLAASTTYYLRVKLVNEWGLVEYINFDSPFTTAAVAEIGSVVYTYASPLLKIVAPVTSFNAASATLSVFVNNNLKQEMNITEAGDYMFDVDSFADTVLIRVSLVVDGHIVSEKTLEAHNGSSVSLAPVLTEMNTIKTAPRIKVGQYVTLTPQNALNTLIVQDDTVFKKEGDLYKAVRPGFSRVDEYDPSGTVVSKGMLISYPEAVGEGRVFLFVTEKFPNNTVVWDSPENWLCLVGEGTYPNGKDDVAIMPFYNTTNPSANLSIYFRESTTIGRLYVGDNFDNIKSLMFMSEQNANAVLRFEVSDGEAGIYAVGGTYTKRSLNIVLGPDNKTPSKKLSLVCVSPTVFDYGFIDKVHPSDFYRVRFKFDNRIVDITIPEGSYLRFVNANVEHVGIYMTLTQSVKIMGGGVFWNDSAIGINMTYRTVTDIPDLSEFTGTIRTTGHGRVNQSCPASFTFENIFNGDNVTLEAAGYCLPNEMNDVVGRRNSGNWDIPGYITSGLGEKYDANSTVGQIIHHMLPRHKLILKGGTWVASGINTDVNDSDGITPSLENRIDNVTIAKGTSMLFLHTDGVTQKTYTNEVRFHNVTHEDKSMLIVKDYGIANTASLSNKMGFWMNDVENHAIGGGNEPAESTYTYSIVPWIASKEGKYQYNLFFGGYNSDNKLVKTSILGSFSISESTSAYDNVNSAGYSLAITEDKTINSLVTYFATAADAEANCNLGANKKLTITSGGLILQNYGRIGSETGYNAGTAGTVEFPNTAYVFSARGAADNNSAIWSKIIAPNGLAINADTKLILGGDQRGIDGEIVVNNGTLELAPSARIDVPVRLVSGNAFVTVKNPISIRSQNLHIDDVYGFKGKINLDYVGEATVNEIKVGDKVFTAGSYGSSESGADIVDDVHFTGTGILKIGSSATIIVIR